MDRLNFDNRFVTELPGDTENSLRRREVFGACWSPVQPTPVTHPRLLAYSEAMAKELDLTEEDIQSPWFAEVFAGNRLLPGMEPFAACYGGHQFGNWAGQLGDGRAISLGEVVNRAGKRWELQLKGAGPTPYSRTADGRAVLRSSIREFLCSEAMHHLGVPTTRALSLVATGEEVVRDMFYDGNPEREPGAVVCRVSPSFIRFGNFEILAARQENDLLEQLVDFTIHRDFPHLEGDAPVRRQSWFNEVCERTARMVVEWMRVGFVHGVMNTDNMSILGLTIDYGPYGWLEDFDPDWTPNTTDAQGRRYRFGYQGAVAQWNLMRLADAVHPVIQDVEALKSGMERYYQVYTSEYDAMLRRKFGFPDSATKEDDAVLMQEALAMLRDLEVDYTLFFRLLGELEPAPEAGPGAEDAENVFRHFAPAFYREEKVMERSGAFLDWLGRWQARLQADGQSPEAHRMRMRRVNPKYVLRNYLAQEAIELAESGDISRVRTLLEVMCRPYDEQPEYERFAARRPEWARHKPGSSMLSCSS
ncbi:MAG: YdiU family protein [Gemmatimonadota bacterium]